MNCFRNRLPYVESSVTNYLFSLALAVTYCLRDSILQLVVARQYIQFSNSKPRISSKAVLGSANFAFRQTSGIITSHSLRSISASDCCVALATVWWAWVDSNYRPHPYQGCALTT